MDVRAARRIRRRSGAGNGPGRGEHGECHDELSDAAAVKNVSLSNAMTGTGQ